MKLYTVNELLEQGNELSGNCIQVEGILSFEFENISISHWPKAERHDECYASSIWIDEYYPLYSFNESQLERWSGKRIVILGVVEFSTPHPDSGYGHFSLWPARIIARRIDLLKTWSKDHS